IDHDHFPGIVPALAAKRFELHRHSLARIKTRNNHAQLHRILRAAWYRSLKLPGPARDLPGPPSDEFFARLTSRLFSPLELAFLLREWNLSERSPHRRQGALRFGELRAPLKHRPDHAHHRAGVVAARRIAVEAVDHVKRHRLALVKLHHRPFGRDPGADEQGSFG